MKKKEHDRPFRPEDYNETTEPLEAPPELFAVGSSPAGNPASAAAPTIPATQPIFLPSGVGAPAASPSHQQPQASYPVLPPAPFKTYRGQPPGGAVPSGEERPARRRSRLPGVIRFCFVLVQLVLLARVVCLVFGVQNTALWLTLLFAASDLFLLPVRGLAGHLNLSILAGTSLLTYLEYLVALLGYGLLSWFLSLLLRAFLR